MNVGAGKPDHEPGEAVSWLPCEALPEIDGAPVFAGGAVTRAVGADMADDGDPTPLVPVTVTLSVKPASEACGVYVDEVAPEIGAVQFAPLRSQSAQV